jgi:hypothetical protein
MEGLPDGMEVVGGWRRGNIEWWRTHGRPARRNGGGGWLEEREHRVACYQFCGRPRRLEEGRSCKRWAEQRWAE